MELQEKINILKRIGIYDDVCHICECIFARIGANQLSYNIIRHDKKMSDYINNFIDWQNEYTLSCLVSNCRPIDECYITCNNLQLKYDVELHRRFKNKNKSKLIKYINV